MSTNPDTLPKAAAPPVEPSVSDPTAVRAFSEATTVARAQDGDTDAFEQLVRAYGGALFRLGFRMLSDRGYAQDAVQDTFVQAWRRLPELQDPQAFRAWIYQLMTRRCLNEIRTRDRRRTGVVPDPEIELDSLGSAVGAGAIPGPEAAAQTGALHDSLTAALDLLPPDLRACWVLHEMHDLSYPAIAYAMGVPLSTVRGRISRARLQLAKGLAAWR